MGRFEKWHAGRQRMVEQWQGSAWLAWKVISWKERNREHSGKEIYDSKGVRVTGYSWE